LITEVRFRLAGDAQPLILVPASVNGTEPCELILDSGAGTTLLSPELATRAGVPVTATKEGMGAGGKITVELGEAESIRVGELTHHEVPVAITGDLHRISRAIGAEVHGALGYSFLRHNRLEVDYAASTLWLGPGGAGRSEGMPFQLAHSAKPLVLVPAWIEGTGPYAFAVDTGASVTVISPELALQLGIRTDAAPAMTGGGGTMRASAGMVRSLTIGEARSLDLTVMVADFLGPLSQVVGTSLDGIVGYNFLRGFRVTIDYPDSRLGLWSPT
jgi:predicted aspartyl protease